MPRRRSDEQVREERREARAGRLGKIGAYMNTEQYQQGVAKRAAGESMRKLAGQTSMVNRNAPTYTGGFTSNRSATRHPQ